LMRMLVWGSYAPLECVGVGPLLGA
jgi:hypothetical protein